MPSTKPAGANADLTVTPRKRASARALAGAIVAAVALACPYEESRPVYEAATSDTTYAAGVGLTFEVMPDAREPWVAWVRPRNATPDTLIMWYHVAFHGASGRTETRPWYTELPPQGVGGTQWFAEPTGRTFDRAGVIIDSLHRLPAGRRADSLANWESVPVNAPS